MSRAWGPDDGGTGRPGRAERPGRPVLRRATDRYLTVGFVAFALFGWVLVVRVGVFSDEPWGALYYLPPTLLMTYAAVGMTRLLFKRWGRQPPPG